MHPDEVFRRPPPAPLEHRVDPPIPVVSSHDGYAIGQALEHLPGQVFRPLALGDVHERHEHVVQSAGRRRQSHREQYGQPFALQGLQDGLGLE